MKTPLLPMALLALASLPSLLDAQPLPTGMNITPIYDTSKAGLSFRKDNLSITGMYEVPGKARHFIVLGYFGYLWTLYPDTTRPDTVLPYGPVKHYSRTQVANFNTWVMKGWEFGATGAAFDPNFAQNRRFYVIYNKYGNPSQYAGGTTPRATSIEGPDNANARTVIDRYVMSTDYTSMVRDTEIVSIPRGTGYGSANIMFGTDGMLYIASNAYNTSSWDSTTMVRKILRIDVSQQDPGKMYAIPTSNPWYNASNAAVKKEVYAFGFRNTYSLSVNYLTGSIFGAETGQSRFEEINKILPGRNYGWNNGGDGATFGSNSNGIEGPCHIGNNLDTTSAGTAYSLGTYMQPYTRTITGTNHNGTYTCANFTNATWFFTRQGTPTDGLTSSMTVYLNPNGTFRTGQTASVSAISPAFRGDPASPFYGYMFITDIMSRNFLAAKEGQPLQNVGVITGVNFTGDQQHNGPTTFAEDSHGNLYPILMSSSSSGAFQYFDIFRLNHPQLTPLATPRSQVWSDGTVSIRSHSGRIGRGEGTLVNSAMAGLWLEIPKGYSGADLYNVKGRLVWSYRGRESSVLVPTGLEMGILQVKYLR